MREVRSRESMFRIRQRCVAADTVPASYPGGSGSYRKFFPLYSRLVVDSSVDVISSVPPPPQSMRLATPSLPCARAKGRNENIRAFPTHEVHCPASTHFGIFFFFFSPLYARKVYVISPPQRAMARNLRRRIPRPGKATRPDQDRSSFWHEIWSEREEYILIFSFSLRSWEIPHYAIRMQSATIRMETPSSKTAGLCGRFGKPTPAVPEAGSFQEISRGKRTQFLRTVQRHPN